MTPFLCIRSRERISGSRLYVNINISSEVAPPKDKKFDEDKLVDRYINFCQGMPDDGAYSIPLISSPLAYTKEIDGKRHYGVNVAINDKFAISRVMGSKIVLDYTVGVIFSVLDSKFSDFDYQKRHQYIGHKFDSDFQHYDVLEEKSVELTRDLVINKVMPTSVPHADTRVEDSQEEVYDLHYRPAKKFLTLSVQAEKQPKSISFNDDHIIVELSENDMIDIYIPLKIDLEVPIRYRYDTESMLLRVVFKVIEL